MKFPKVILQLPDWIEDFFQDRGSFFASLQDRMRLVIELSHCNFQYKTGGPFGAAIFERETGRLLSAGVNLVESTNYSIAHAEIMAIAVAQSQLGHYDLGAEDMSVYELVTSTEPCTMCLGAVLWSGVRAVVCGARGEDAIAVGFDEGIKPANWVSYFEQHGIRVKRDVLREEARAVLLEYKESGGTIYNARQGDKKS